MDDSQVFIVHVWAPKPGFRASARRVDSDQPQLLNSPQELADYFAHASGAASVAPAPDLANGPSNPPSSPLWRTTP
jgi:hypothetical protein